VALIVSVLVIALVMAVAAGAIGREARRLDALPPRAVFDLEEAVQWVAEHLPEEVTARLSYDDVRRVLDLSLDHLRGLGLAVQAVVSAQLAYLQAISAVGPPADDEGA